MGGVKLPPELDRCARRQSGIVTREQASEAGISRSAIAHAVTSGRWNRVHPRTYATFSGRLTTDALLWAAVLYAGAGSCVSHETAAAKYGWVPMHQLIHVTTPLERQAQTRPGIRTHRARRHPGDVRTHSGLPITSPERTLLDLLSSARTAGDALSAVGRATQSGKLDQPEFARRLGASRCRWRAVTLECLDDITHGSHSYLELRFVHALRKHGVPIGARQVASGRTRSDMAYDGLVIELDGRLGHDTADGRFRDMRRDNVHSLARKVVLRFGWADVVDEPCGVASQVAAALGISAKTCGIHCSLPRAPACTG